MECSSGRVVNHTALENALERHGLNGLVEVWVFGQAMTFKTLPDTTDKLGRP